MKGFLSESPHKRMMCLLRSKYALFFCKLQSVDCQLIAKLKGNCEMKLH